MTDPTTSRTDGAAPAEDRSAPPRRPRGLLTVLVFVYALFALSATARSLVQIIGDFGAAPVAYSLSLVSALTYISATWAMARRGPGSSTTLAIVVIELLGVLVVGTLTVLDPQLFPEATVWSTYGIGYGFVPLALPVLALVLSVSTRRRASAAAA